MSALAMQATDPVRSVVVEACAGSGKTWMLVTRIFRLLMAGESPDSILAITFTRKAADEMLERLDSLLEQCILLPDADLAGLLTERCCAGLSSDLPGVRNRALEIISARRGVEINTFHGWFTSLCQLAPAQLGFSRQAEPSELEDYWLDQAWADWMTDLESGAADPAGQQAFRDLLQSAGAWKTRSMMQALCRQRAAWRILLREQGQAGLEQQLEQDFQLAAAQTAQADFLASPHVDGWLQTVVRCLLADSDAKQKKAAELQAAWGTRDFGALVKALRTGEGAPLATIKLTKTGLAALSESDVADFQTSLDAVQMALGEVMARQVDLEWHGWTLAALRLLPAFLAQFEAVKARGGVIDFEDLEITAGDIMADDEASAWVQMRLERRTRHLLLDEFQDTNPLQWQILRQWLSSQGTGGGQTVFMVGDPKQSIYRFRRAEARLFTHVSDWLEQHFQAQVLRTDQSRRCAAGVLAAVNAVFVGPDARRQGNTPIREHAALYDSPGSGLYLMPLVPPPAGNVVPPRSGWLDAPRGGPLQLDGEGAAEALAVAATLAAWKAQGRIRRWGDVMILVRRRDDASPMGEALQALAIPHSIQDRSARFASLMWSDSLALLRVLLSPLNERSLVQLLRSPFFDVAPAALERWFQALMRLPAETPISGRLQSAADACGGEVAAALATVALWRQWAAELPLHEVLERIFRDTDIEAATLARAPEQERELARQHWAWLITWALDLGKGRMPHPQRALAEAVRLAEYGSAATQHDAEADGVRVMTVHGSKGLEADIVWLLAANRPAAGGRGGDVQALLHWPPEAHAPLHLSLTGGAKTRGHARLPIFAGEDRAQADEADHLLYVALTRARKAVHVSGTAHPKNGVQPGSWYERLAAVSLAQAGQWEMASAGSAYAGNAHAGNAHAGNAHARNEHAGGTHTANGASAASQSGPCADTVEWDTRPALPVMTPPVGQLRELEDHLATRRGEAWHACLEHVDAIFFSDFSRWWAHSAALPVCAGLLARVDDNTVSEIRTRLAAMAENPALAQWLDPGRVQACYNEFGWMDGEGRLHRADRILRTDAGWIVVDYKWSWSDTDLPAYCAQLRRYGRALRQTLAPEAPIRALLLSSSGACEWVNMDE